MKYFSALADATFARAAFAAAGLDFDALLTAKNNDCLKAFAIAKQSGADAEKLMADAVAENLELTGKLADVEKTKGEIAAGRAAAVAQNTALLAALDAVGLKPTASVETDGKVDAAKFKAAHELAVAKTARQMVAKAGHPGLLDEIAPDPAKGAKAKLDPTLTGLARTRAAFAAQGLHSRN